MKKQEVAVINFEKFDVAQLPELQGKKEEIKSLIEANPIVEITDNASYELAKKSRTAVKTLRTSLQSEQKDVKKKIKEFVLDVVDSEYDSIIEGVKKAENARQDKVTVWEAKKEEERLEKVRLEQERIDRIKSEISRFFGFWNNRIGGLAFSDLDSFETEMGEAIINYDKSALQEFEVLFTDNRSTLYSNFESKSHILTEHENIRLEQIRFAEEKERQLIEAEKIAEKQRIERENFEKERLKAVKEQQIATAKFRQEKQAFEQKSQFEIKNSNRIKELTDFGLKYDFQSTFSDGMFFIDILDIKTYSDEKWDDLISKIKENKLEQNVENREFETEPIVSDAIVVSSENNQYANYNEAYTHEEATKELPTLEVDFEETWHDILQEYYCQSSDVSFNESEQFANWLDENYNVPTRKN